jgi:L-aminopeptidase/D-esterase-like protein
VVPIGPTAAVFDLGPLGRPDRWPTADDGYAACEAASRTVPEGSVGAGTGTTVGKILGVAAAMKGGVGSWSIRQGDLVVAALAVVNALGDVRDANGGIIAGARAKAGFVDARAYLASGQGHQTSFGRSPQNTTLVVVGTNADLPRGALAELAHMAGDALAQRITPVGTQYDGDVIFAVSTARVPVASALPIEILAQDATAMAIERAVRMAKGTRDIPGLAD